MMLMTAPKYILSFTACGVLKHESVRLAQLYLELKDWDAARRQVVSQNLLQSRTSSSLKRLAQELCLRLQTLTEEQMLVLVGGTDQDQKNILWLAICKRHDYISEFMLEVIREKCRGLDFDLTSYDYDSFFNAKSEWHPELDQLSQSTGRKLKQVLFRILREVGITSKNSRITAQRLSPSVIRAIVHDDPDLLYLFPIPDTQVMEIIREYR